MQYCELGLATNAGGTAVGIEATPVPDRLAVCGLFVPLSETVSVAVDVAVDVGVKLTVIEQVAPGFKLDGQLFVCANGPEGLIEIPLISNGAWPAAKLKTCAAPLVVFST